MRGKLRGTRTLSVQEVAVHHLPTNEKKFQFKNVHNATFGTKLAYCSFIRKQQIPSFRVFCYHYWKTNKQSNHIWRQKFKCHTETKRTRSKNPAGARWGPSAGKHGDVVKRQFWKNAQTVLGAGKIQPFPSAGKHAISDYVKTGISHFSAHYENNKPCTLNGKSMLQTFSEQMQIEAKSNTNQLLSTISRKLQQCYKTCKRKFVQ